MVRLGWGVVDGGWCGWGGEGEGDFEGGVEVADAVETEEVDQDESPETEEERDEEVEEGRTSAKKRRKSILGTLKGYIGFTDKVGKNPAVDEEVEIPSFEENYCVRFIRD